MRPIYRNIITHVLLILMMQQVFGLALHHVSSHHGFTKNLSAENSISVDNDDTSCLLCGKFLTDNNDFCFTAASPSVPASSSETFLCPLQVRGLYSTGTEHTSLRGPPALLI